MAQMMRRTLRSTYRTPTSESVSIRQTMGRKWPSVEAFLAVTRTLAVILRRAAEDVIKTSRDNR